jgi:hypothetical protein
VVLLHLLHILDRFVLRVDFPDLLVAKIQLDLVQRPDTNLYKEGSESRNADERTENDHTPTHSFWSTVCPITDST